MKNNLSNLIRWFCSKLTYNDLASVVPVLLEVLGGSRKGIKLKSAEDQPPHYRQFRVDPTPPLIEDPDPRTEPMHWRQIQEEHERKHGKKITVVRRRSGSALPPEKCVCHHCHAPARYLYLNNGKLGSQVKCKVCGQTSPTDKPRRESRTQYWCPHCGMALGLWKQDGICNAFKCSNDKCRFYTYNLKALTPQEHQMRKEGKTSQFKLRYIFREYHFASEQLPLERPDEAPVDFNRIHNNLNTVGLCLTFSVSFGLSGRMCASALQRVFGIHISHQTVINYINSAAAYLSDFVDNNSPLPQGISGADETYITIDGCTRYTWLIIDKTTRAICGYNLSEMRSAAPALALLKNCYGPPESPKCNRAELITDGLPSYDSAIAAYNTEAKKATNNAPLIKHTVIGLQNLDPESEEYREYKQLVERLNRTYKYHTRPRAGFKSFNGAVALTTLFVAYYNFMRPHGSLRGSAPVALPCLQGKTLYPLMWVELLRQAS